MHRCFHKKPVLRAPALRNPISSSGQAVSSAAPRSPGSHSSQPVAPAGSACPRENVRAVAEKRAADEAWRRIKGATAKVNKERRRQDGAARKDRELGPHLRALKIVKHAAPVAPLLAIHPALSAMFAGKFQTTLALDWGLLPPIDAKEPIGKQSPPENFAEQLGAFLCVEKDSTHVRQVTWGQVFLASLDIGPPTGAEQCSWRGLGLCGGRATLGAWSEPSWPFLAMWRQKVKPGLTQVKQNL